RAFLEDPRAAARADRTVQARKRAPDRLALAVEHVLPADRLHVAAALEQLLDRLPEAVEVQPAACGAPAARLFGEQLRARDVQRIDALRHEQQVLLPEARLAQRVEVLRDVSDRAEIDRAFDPQDLELRALDQA